MTPGRIVKDGQGMIYDPERVTDPHFDLLDPEWWHRDQVPRMAAAGRGSVWFVASNAEDWAIRHYRRGGFVGRILTDHYLWLGRDATRSFREFTLLAALHDQGLPVPRPVAATYRRSGITYTADLATARIDAVPMSQKLLDGAFDSAQWREIGRVVSQFHDAGVYHADLTAHNLMIGSHSTVFLLDFDRGRLRADGGWKQNNLERLKRSLNKISRDSAAIDIGATQWQDLLSGYRG